MGSRYLVELADWCRAAGLVTIEVDGWQHRARSSGGFDGDRPWIIAWHHTASSTSPENDANYMCFGSSDSPIANLLLARDGSVWVMAAGGTNTNGKGGPITSSRGTVPKDSLNTHAVSIEAANNGVGEHWPEAQIDAYFVLSLMLAARLGLLPDDICEHQVYAPDRKIDPATANAVQGPWRPRQSNSSGTWLQSDVENELWTRAVLSIPPGEEDEMAKVLIQDRVTRGLFTLEGVPVSAEARDALVAQGYVIVEQDHPEWREYVMGKLGSVAFNYGQNT